MEQYMSAETIQQNMRQPNTKMSEVLAVERLQDHFPLLEDELGLRAIHLIRADLNTAGSFKWRGAKRAVQRQMSLGASSVMTASAGNHAIGVLLAALEYKLSLRVIVPNVAPPQKSTELYRLWQDGGGDPDMFELEVHGDTFDESLEYATASPSGNQTAFIHPYDDLDVIGGQGTLLDDIYKAVPNVTDIIFPTGGGGLLAGLVSRAALRHQFVDLHPIEASGSNSLSRTLKTGSIDPVEATNPNKLYGGSAVKMVGHHVIETLWRHLYRHSLITTAHDSGVNELANNYEDRKSYILPLEPTSLLAVQGLRVLLENKQLANDSVVVVIGTGHNESYTRLLPQLQKNLNVVRGYTVR